MKALRSSDPRIAPDRLKMTIVEFTTSTSSVGPIAMSSLGGVTSWSAPKLWMLLACAVPANPRRVSGDAGVVSGFAGLVDADADDRFIASPYTARPAESDFPRS